MALYDVLHDTTYRYASAVALSQQIAHLRPRPCAGQQTLAHRLEIVPAPAQCSERSDFFGNPVTAFALHAPHAQLVVRSPSHSRQTAQRRFPTPGGYAAATCCWSLSPWSLPAPP